MLRPLCRPHWKMMAKMRMTGLCFFPPCAWNGDDAAADDADGDDGGDDDADGDNGDDDDI